MTLTASAHDVRLGVGMIKSALLMMLCAALLSGCGVSTPAQRDVSASDQVFADAFKNQQGDLQVTGAGTVTRILSDDNDGSRHQRFIVELTSGQTLLIAHNIDIAPRVDSLKVGDRVEFGGVYEWNDEGGIVHWTHHDPQGAHQAGWINHNGVVYQ